MTQKNVSVVLLALMLAAMAIVPMVSALDEKQNIPPEISIAEPPRIITEEKIFLEIRQKILSDLKASTIIDEDEKEELIIQLNAIWNGDSSMPDSEREKVLLRVSQILLDTFNQSPAPKWVGCTNTGCPAPHNDMARIAGQKMGIAGAYQTVLYNNAGVPDTWGGSANHYAISGAPGEVKNWADQARPLIRSGSNPSLGYTYLAYAMHFMSDMSVPFHSTPTDLLAHSAYESNVNDHWTSGHTYVNAVTGTNYYYYITDPSTSAQNLASYSNQYQSYLASKIFQAGWQNDPTLVQYTNDCLMQGTRYNMGLIDYANRP
jgi:hypothetical protein